MDQELTDFHIESTWRYVCKKYGDAWHDKSCATTKNFMRSLYVQRAGAQLVLAHERKMGWRYDAIMAVRVDTLFTTAIPHAAWEELLVRVKHGKAAFVTPAWGRWHGFNDRFLLRPENLALLCLTESIRSRRSSTKRNPDYTLKGSLHGLSATT